MVKRSRQLESGHAGRVQPVYCCSSSSGAASLLRLALLTYDRSTNSFSACGWSSVPSLICSGEGGGRTQSDSWVEGRSGARSSKRLQGDSGGVARCA